MSSVILSKISLVKGDITKLAVDAIVNAANSSLLGGGGVDGAIHKAAGPKLVEECRLLDGCNVGEAKITKAYDIEDVKAIIHTVGPEIYDEVEEEDNENLSSCYSNCLDLARDSHLRSIAFPSISTGVYHFPKHQASVIALTTVKQWLSEDENSNSMDKIIFCVFDSKDEEIYKKNIGKIIGSDPDIKNESDIDSPDNDNPENKSNEDNSEDKPDEDNSENKPDGNNSENKPDEEDSAKTHNSFEESNVTNKQDDTELKE